MRSYYLYCININRQFHCFSIRWFVVYFIALCDTFSN